MKPLTKNLWRNIHDSFGRFVAISLIIMLGVLIFVGVKATGPTLKQSLSARVAADHLSDIQLLAAPGFSPELVDAIKQTPDVTIQTQKFQYATAGDDHRVIALYGQTAQQKLDHYRVTSGRQIKADHELLLDAKAKTAGYKLGQKLTFDPGSALAQQTYTVVGFIDLPQYIDTTTRGAANIGAGTVDYFAVVRPSQLTLPAPTLVSLQIPRLKDADPFSASYKSAVAKTKRQVMQRIKTATQATTADLKAQQAATAMVTSTSPMAQAFAAPQIQTQTREDLPGFSDYGSSADRIAAIANVFPVFFFLVAALITFTTVTRMVEEARGQIGTLKALGYGKWAIAKNYLTYALLASLLGTVLGALIGSQSIPRIVLSLYRMYLPMRPIVAFPWALAAWALGFALMATVGAAAIVVWRELRENPAALLRPRAPKSAKRIWLEYITPLWRRFSFNQKVSYRNLMRYKSRLFMTILGIAGGTALILTGFAIKDSITATGVKQYQDVIHYQAILRTDAPTNADLLKTLQDTADYRDSTAATAAVATIQAHGKSLSGVNLFAPKQRSTFKRVVTLTNINSQQTLTVPKTGLVLTQKAAQKLKVKAGQTVKVTLTSGQTHALRVQAVVANYLGHFGYLSSDTLATLAGRTLPANTLLLRLHQQTAKQRQHFGQKVLASPHVSGVSFTNVAKQTITNMSAMLDPVVLIFILLSALLSFVVLYNLTNINISERLRELSTIKVLGFYDREVTLYVSRENIVLTVVGILFGFGIGHFLSAYILQQAETGIVVFPLTVSLTGYLSATLLMTLFTASVMWLTHRRLQHVDMVAALKASD